MNPSDATPATLLGLLSSIPENQTAIIHADQIIVLHAGAKKNRKDLVTHQAQNAARHHGHTNDAGIARNVGGRFTLVRFHLGVEFQILTS